MKITELLTKNLTDAQLKALPIEARNEVLDTWAAEDAADSYDPDAAYELWLENGGAAAAVIQWETLQDELRANAF